MDDYIILCDIDGVLAWNNHRLHYLQNKDYESFYSVANLSADLLIKSGSTLLEVLQKNAQKTILVTGRPERIREATEAWLDQKMIQYDELLMRRDHDYRPSAVVKKELIANVIREWDHYEMHYYFIDDDPTNVRAVENMHSYIQGLTFGSGLFGKLGGGNG